MMKRKLELIDIVLTDWLYWDENFEVIKVKFMPEESYNSTKNLQLLKNMVINCDKPCNTWPSYPVEIRGQASKFF